MQTVTFYSYKGGTGRSLLLANLAVLLAKLGRRVVAVDFDLEAPGLPYKFFPEQRPRSDGVVEWLRDTIGGHPPASLDDYLVDVDLDAAWFDHGWLKLMPAGRAPSPNYFQDLLRLNLDRRLDDGVALDALVDLQQRLATDFDTDYLFLDARTGITPTNPVTTHVLADTVVALTLGTFEQLEGTRAVLRGIKPLESLTSGKRIRLHVVLSRLPSKPESQAYETTEQEQQRTARVIDFLNEPARPLGHTLEVDELLLLHTEASLTGREQLLLRESGPLSRSPLNVDYQRAALAIFGNEVGDRILKVLEDSTWEGSKLEQLAVFFARPDYLTVARGQSLPKQPADQAGSREPNVLEEIEVLRQVAQRDSSRLPELANRLQEAAGQMRRLGRLAEAAESLEDAVALLEDLAAAHPDQFRPDLATALNNQSVHLSDLGRPEEALAAIEQAVAIRRELAEARPDAFMPDLAGSLNNQSNRLSDLGRREEALAAIEQAVAIRRELAAKYPARFGPDLARTLKNLARLLDQLDREQEADRARTRAREIERNLLDPPSHPPSTATGSEATGKGIPDG